jgi:hypothetical protein
MTVENAKLKIKRNSQKKNVPPELKKRRFSLIVEIEFDDKEADMDNVAQALKNALEYSYIEWDALAFDLGSLIVPTNTHPKFKSWLSPMEQEALYGLVLFPDDEEPPEWRSDVTFNPHDASGLPF